MNFKWNWKMKMKLIVCHSIKDRVVQSSLVITTMFVINTNVLLFDTVDVINCYKVWRNYKDNLLYRVFAQAKCSFFS